MNINDTYTSNSDYLKSQDLEAGKEFRVVICGAEMAELGEQKKIVLKFEGQEKGLVLNKTNAMTIAHVNGDDTNQWMGKAIFIYSTMVDYGGKQVPAIRVRAEMQQAQMQQPQQQAPQQYQNQPNPNNNQSNQPQNNQAPIQDLPKPTGFDDFSDDIPF